MSHLITNWNELVTTPAREDALAIIEVGMEAVKTDPAIRRKISLTGNTLAVGKENYDLDKFEKIYVVSIGKAALDAAKTLEDILGDRITKGIVLDIRTGAFSRLTSLAGTHPIPSLANIAATEQIVNLAKQITAKDLFITIISGGGSALLCMPYELSCDQIARITKALTKNGAKIQELNTVRKHLSKIQGGQLAALVYPAAVISLIFSDVPGDDLSMVASGPTFMDTTTVQEAESILIKYSALKTCELNGCNLRETPKNPSLFENVHNELIVSSSVAARAMSQEAEKRGYQTTVSPMPITGEAKEIGTMLMAKPKPGEAFIGTGETTVTIKATDGGKGGRNQEVALGAIANIKEGTVVISFASDGVDNLPVAGAIADEATLKRTQELKLDPAEYLAKNRSYDFFEPTGDLIKTGITGINVSDFFLALNKK